MTADNIYWYNLPAKIRVLILEALLKDGCSLAGFATVSREWQTVIERHNFAKIKLTSSRLIDFDSMIHRNRAPVHYIWLCIELEEYDCDQCTPHFADPDVAEMMMISNTDNALITIAILDLFSTLSAWEPKGNLFLDISVHSPSDSEHWFKYLTFEPDISSDECDLDRCPEHSMLIKLNDHQHGWVDGRQDSVPPGLAIDKVFDEIMDEGMFSDEEKKPMVAATSISPGSNSCASTSTSPPAVEADRISTDFCPTS